jgi:hypothetical protein
MLTEPVSRRETGECVVRSRREGGGVFVYLSEPILRYRTRADVIDALLVRFNHHRHHLAALCRLPHPNDVYVRVGRAARDDPRLPLRDA